MLVRVATRYSALLSGALLALLSACAQHTQATIPRTLSAVPPDRDALSSTINGCDASTTSNFNGTPITSGSTIWLTAVMKVQGVGNAPVTVNLSSSTISFSGSGTPYSINVPNASIKVDPTARSATLTWNGSSWSETVPYPFSGNVLLSAVEFPVAADLPGGVQNVSWSGHFASSQTGITVQWAWSAAIFKQFSADYNALGVKPVDANNTSQYLNSDHAGTPENFKSYVVGGATGGGGSNYTGGLSGTAEVTTCRAALFPNLNGPDGIAFNPSNGYLYVANILNSTITVYDRHGTQIPMAGAFPNLSEPGEPAVGAGLIYVPNIQNRNITVYDATGNAVTTSGGFPGLIDTPNSIAFNPLNNYLYVVNYNAASCGGDHVQVFDLNGNPISEPGTFAAPPPCSDIQGGIGFDAFTNQFYLSNGPSGAISVYDPSGNPIATSGSFPGTSGSTEVAYDSANNLLYVGNVTNTNSITVYDGSGNPVAVSGAFANLSQPQALVFDPQNGYLYVANYANNTITVYDQNGNQIFAP